MDELVKDPRSATLNARERAMVDFAISSSESPGSMTKSELEPLRKEGLSDRAILDLTHVIGFFAYANRLVDVLGVPLEPEMTKKSPWV